jgi:2-polyprenyl-6-methoxyphenol hydroxylase-like FAD-dependent oxidoreductase
VSLTVVGEAKEATAPDGTQRVESAGSRVVEEEYDLLLACDGRYSQIRQLVEASQPHDGEIDGSPVTCT